MPKSKNHGESRSTYLNNVGELSTEEFVEDLFTQFLSGCLRQDYIFFSKHTKVSGCTISYEESGGFKEHPNQPLKIISKIRKLSSEIEENRERLLEVSNILAIDNPNEDTHEELYEERDDILDKIFEDSCICENFDLTSRENVKSQIITYIKKSGKN